MVSTTPGTTAQPTRRPPCPVGALVTPSCQSATYTTPAAVAVVPERDSFVTKVRSRMGRGGLHEGPMPGTSDGSNTVAAGRSPAPGRADGADGGLQPRAGAAQRPATVQLDGEVEEGDGGAVPGVATDSTHVTPTPLSRTNPRYSTDMTSTARRNAAGLRVPRLRGGGGPLHPRGGDLSSELSDQVVAGAARGVPRLPKRDSRSRLQGAFGGTSAHPCLDAGNGTRP